MDINNYVDNAKAQLRRGTLEYCVLAAISQREMYASDIIALLKQYDLLVADLRRPDWLVMPGLSQTKGRRGSIIR